MKKKKSEEEKKKKVKTSYLWKHYGLKYEEAMEIYAKGCGICGRVDGRLAIDHIHIKGYKKLPPEEKRKYVRSCLCFMCNTSIKGFEKTSDGARNRKQLEGTIRYFKIYKLKGEE